ncbi:MAG: hypothetical protein ABI222_05500, partial [Opitutaceae bacterium]
MFLKSPALLFCSLQLFAVTHAASPAWVAPDSFDGKDILPRAPSVAKLVVLHNDLDYRFVMHDPAVVMRGDGRQPFLFLTAKGTLVCQAQLAAKPYGTKKKMVYPVLLATVVSRDGGKSWNRWTHEENHDDVNLEGGIVQCADGTILALDSYVMPGEKKDHGIGELWKSHDDFRTLEGPSWVDFFLPTIQFAASTDDGGRPHAAARLHRSIIELPNGDLLTTMYAQFAGDTASAGYIASMKKSRTVVIRSGDH